VTQSDFIKTLNGWGEKRIPFLFMVDFEQVSHYASPLHKVNPQSVLFNLNGFTNSATARRLDNTSLAKRPMAFGDYATRFENVMNHLHRGDSYLVNLTIKTEVGSVLNLENLFHNAGARYKLCFGNEFLFFSPETFVRISDGRIHSFPMKGTIDAAIPGARELILNDPKELCEHVTIVDLIRNDLGRVADKVKVKRFRYVDELKTSSGGLLQVSSEIEGSLMGNYWSRIGDILTSLLPAGSVSGAPKPRTIEIIKEVEQEKRGYYSGICGYFDGMQLDSCVIIRFIENNNGRLFYRSGGGITTQSSAMDEYLEALAKIYVPAD
jgi:para-aminobenzoate synthetase component 1